jgi:hypothetical protein
MSSIGWDIGGVKVKVARMADIAMNAAWYTATSCAAPAVAVARPLEERRG